MVVVVLVEVVVVEVVVVEVVVVVGAAVVVGAVVAGGTVVVVVGGGDGNRQLDATRATVANPADAHTRPRRAPRGARPAFPVPNTMSSDPSIRHRQARMERLTQIRRRIPIIEDPSPV